MQIVASNASNRFLSRIYVLRSRKPVYLRRGHSMVIARRFLHSTVVSSHSSITAAAEEEDCAEVSRPKWKTTAETVSPERFSLASSSPPSNPPSALPTARASPTRTMEGQSSAPAVSSNRLHEQENKSDLEMPALYTMRQLPTSHRHHFEALSSLLHRGNVTECRSTVSTVNDNESWTPSRCSLSSCASCHDEVEGCILVACHITVDAARHKHPIDSGTPLISSPTTTTTTSTITGINFAMHRLLHPSPTRVFQGLLKGCAEQNALGALAAAGYNYVYDTKALYLVAGIHQYRRLDHNEQEPDRMSSSAHSSDASTIRVHSAFPCRQCWQYLVDVGHMKHQLGLSPLQVWVRLQQGKDLDSLPVLQRLREAEMWRTKNATKKSTKRGNNNAVKKTEDMKELTRVSDFPVEEQNCDYSVKHNITSIWKCNAPPESNENSLNTSQGIESQLSQKQSVTRHSSCLYEPSQTENSQNWCDHQSALPHKTGIRVRHPSNSTNNKNKNSHYQNSSSFISTTTAAFPGSATQDASSLFSSALSSSLPSSRPHSTANYASGAATHTTSQRIPPEATTSTLTLGNREKAAASSSSSVLNADPFSHRQAYCMANPKNNHNPIHSAPLISSAHLAGGRAQRREDGEDGGEGRRVGGLRRVEMAAISTFRAWKRKLRQRENPQQQEDGETPGSAAAAASLLLFAPGVSPAACSTYSTPALLLQCLLDFHQRPGGLENLFDDESNPVWSYGKRQREPLSIPSSESFHAPDSSLPSTASKRNDSVMRHHAEQVAQWIIDHLPQLLAARQHRCNIQNTNMTVAAASSTNNNSAPSKENLSHFPSSRAGSQHNGESSTCASALDAAALFTADGNIPPKGDLIAPLLVELTRFYLRMGILSNVAAAPDWTTQSSTSHFAATGSLTGLSGGKSSSRPNASGPTAAASSRSVISWLCQVLWGLVRNPNRSRWMMDSSPKANAFNPAAATPDRWVWVVLQEWVVAILTLQQQQQDPEGSPEEPPPEQEKHGNTVVASGCCAPGLPSLPPPSSSSSTTTTTFRPTSRSAADTGRESLSHDRRTPYESRAPPPSLKPSWQFFSSSVVCHILREEIMAPLRSDTPHSHHRPPPLDAEEASSPLHSFALSYAHYRPTLKSLEERYACKSRDEILLWLCFFLQSQPGYRSLLHVTPPMSNSSWYHQQEAARVWELWMHTIIGSTSRRGMKEKSKEEPKGLRDGPEDGGTVLCSLSSTKTVLLLERVLHAL